MLNILSIVISGQFIGYILILIGIYASIWWLIDNLKSGVQIILSLLRPFFQPQDDLPIKERFGSWAVVTGSTDGIGKEYAKELAKRGINIVLISRNESRLVQTANEIESLYPVKTKWIVADFSQGEKVYEHIEKQLAGIPVGILVNNVGIMYEYPEELGKVPEQMLWGMININIAAVTMMTRMLINDMKARGKGAIVNLSSGSSLQPLPLMAVYSASKIYIQNFTLSIREEFAPYGIYVQLVTPMYVCTKMNLYSSTVSAGGILFPDVESYTKSAVFCLGRTSETTGYWSHGIQYGAIRLIPTWARTLAGLNLNIKFRQEYFEQNQMAEGKTQAAAAAAAAAAITTAAAVK